MLDLNTSDKDLLARVWYSATSVGLLQNLKAFDIADDSGAWEQPEVRDFVKSCLKANALALGQTELLGLRWRAELAAAGLVALGMDIRWMRRERWANLDRLTPVEPGA